MGNGQWRAGLYIRLSREDNTKDESLSVQNQRARLLEYCGQAENLTVEEVYADDGRTGTDSNREGFLRLLRDVERRRVNCVVVKDLSRFARNYYEAGYYLEYLFPSLDVRFISLEYPAVDSYLHPEGLESVLIPMQNVINDDFCRQTSVKVRHVLDMKRRRGEYIGAFAPYGYRKDPEDRHRLAVDEQAAPVVREVFRRFLAGESRTEIARRLNEWKVPGPAAYKRACGLKFQNGAGQGGGWSATAVTRLLSNRVYLGELIQGRFRTKSYKVHRQAAVPPEGWFVTPGAHPPLVSGEDFGAAARLLARPVRRTEEGQPGLFAGLLQCADCGGPMHRTRAKGHVYYCCRSYKEGRGCTRHSIRHDRLEEAVMARLAERPAPPAAEQSAPDGGRAQVMERLRRRQEGLYEDWKDGMLTQEEYLTRRERYQRELAGLETAVALPLHGAREEDGEKRALLCRLIQRILVHEGGEVTVCWLPQ